jgi:hypothetical protein
MEMRKFAIGEEVRLLLDSNANNNPADVYTVSRMLPAVSNVWQYRVKRVGDSLERAVSERQLAKAGLLRPTNQSAIESQQDHQRLRNARASERARVTTMRSAQARR